MSAPFERMPGAATWALIEHGFRQSLRGRRLIGLVAIVLAPAAIAIALKALTPAETTDEGLEPVLFIVGTGIVVPLLALFLGVSVLRDEMTSGTIVHMATRPVRRETILIARLLGAAAATTVLAATSLTLAALVIGGPIIEPLMVGIQVGALSSAAYCAIFALMGAMSKRAILIGLAYIIAWENVVASTPLFFKTWTVAYWGRSIIVQQGLASSTVVSEMLAGAAASSATSMLVLILIAVGAAGVGALWFGRKEIAGAEPE